MKIIKWFDEQTRITRIGIYHMVVVITYLISRAISIMIGWNATWI